MFKTYHPVSEWLFGAQHIPPFECIFGVQNILPYEWESAWCSTYTTLGVSEWVFGVQHIPPYEWASVWCSTYITLWVSEWCLTHTTLSDLSCTKSVSCPSHIKCVANIFSYFPPRLINFQWSPNVNQSSHLSRHHRSSEGEAIMGAQLRTGNRSCLVNPHKTHECQLVKTSRNTPWFTQLPYQFWHLVE